MSQPVNVLEYAAPAERRSLWTWVTPPKLVLFGLSAAVISYLAGPTVGSGVIRVNLVALFWCGVAVACGIGYVLLRLWHDREEGSARAVIFIIVLFVSVAAFVNAQHSVWGYGHLPRMSLRHEYWRSLLVCAAAITAACIFSAARSLFRHLFRGCSTGLRTGGRDVPTHGA